MRSDHLALFVNSLRGGGAERVMVNLARGFVDRGVKVDLVLLEKDGPYLSLVPPEARIIDLRAPRPIEGLDPLSRYLRAERPAGMISALRQANALALWAKRLTGVPTRLVTTIHCAFPPPERTLRYRTARRLMYGWSDEIVAVSRGVAQDFAEVSWLPPERVKVIYNPVVTPEFEALASQSVDHPWLQQPEVPVVLSVARLDSVQKDHPTLIRAISRVRRKLPVRLVILGHGSDAERGKLEALVRELGLQDCVSLPGFAPNPYAYMARASLFVLSSRLEGLPTVLIEAMAAGSKVVATDCPSGPREILEGGRFGPLVPVGDPDEMAAAIERELFAPPAAGRKERAHEFSLAAITEQYLQLFPWTSAALRPPLARSA